jgi:hypothetical protein
MRLRSAGSGDVKRRAAMRAKAMYWCKHSALWTRLHRSLLPPSYRKHHDNDDEWHSYKYKRNHSNDEQFGNTGQHGCSKHWYNLEDDLLMMMIPARATTW